MKVSLRGMKMTTTEKSILPLSTSAREWWWKHFWDKSISSLLAYLVLDKTQCFCSAGTHTHTHTHRNKLKIQVIFGILRLSSAPAALLKSKQSSNCSTPEVPK